MKPNIKRILRKVTWSILVCFCLFQIYLAIRLHWIASCVVPTYSMYPTVTAGDYLITSLRIPGRRVIKKDAARPGHYTVERKKGDRNVRTGDITVFNFPYAKGEERMRMDFGTYFCKRCVAVPGETYRWQWNEGQDSVYLPRREETLPVDSLNFRHYSRSIEYETGWMPKLVNGTVIHADTVMNSYRFRNGYYFMQGDNHADSYDSRFWGILPEDLILGVGLFTWFSKEPDTGKVRWERMFKKL